MWRFLRNRRLILRLRYYLGTHILGASRGGPCDRPSTALVCITLQQQQQQQQEQYFFRQIKCTWKIINQSIIYLVVKSKEFRGGLPEEHTLTNAGHPLY